MKTGIVCLILLGLLTLGILGKPLQETQEELPQLSTVVPSDVMPNIGMPVAIEDATMLIDKTKRIKCECAVFNTETPSDADQPIILQNPINVTCDTEGEEKCLKLCTALAKAAHEDGPKLLCSAVGHYNELRASVHSRICNAKQWKYTGLSTTTPICCHNHAVVDCKSMNESGPSNQL